MASLSFLQNYAAQLEQQFGLPTGLLSGQANAESSWNPSAQNGNATGLMQFMPGTAADYNVDPTDPVSSLYGAAEYDSDLFKKTGSWVQTLADYGTTAGNSLNTNPAAAAVNTIAQAADLKNNFFSGMFGPNGMNDVTQLGPDGKPTNGNVGSSWMQQLESWMSKEKYNAISVIVGAAFVIAGSIAMMKGSEITDMQKVIG